MTSDSYKLLPKLLKHCVVAIYRTGKVRGASDDERWVGAWNMARSRLTQLGLLAVGSSVGPISGLALTSSGMKREAAHQMEGPEKSAVFDYRVRVLFEADTGKSLEGSDAVEIDSEESDFDMASGDKTGSEVADVVGSPTGAAAVRQQLVSEKNSKLKKKQQKSVLDVTSRSRKTTKTPRARKARRG